ncbi:MAG: cytochrome P450 [Proteobacteria bacterium]|nr:cytochrome P450 [Pseudomonadota bacterium]
MADYVVNDDLLDDEIVQNPSPYYAMLREEFPCHWNERWRGWVLTRYDDVYNAMHSPKFLADRITPWYRTRLNDAERERYKETYRALHSFVVFTDPPDHTRLRRIFARAFTPKSVQTMRAITEALVKRHLDEWEGKRSIDLNADFAYPLPANVISTIIGARREDLDRLQHWAEAITTLLLAGVGDDTRLDRAQAALVEFKAYLKVLYDERIDNPRNDMMSWLMEVQRTDPLLTEDDVLHSCIILLNAGHETTQTLICNTLTTLLDLPDELEFLRRNPQSMKTALEEGLRYNGPLKGTIRLAGEDMTLHGEQIAQGDRILLLMGAANRDPAKFADPERFVPTRDPNPHLSFSHGIHFCLGAPLARMEAEIAFNEMLRRFPKMAVEGSFRWEPRILGRSIEAPIRLALG